MKDKTYRIRQHLAEKVQEINLEYIKEKEEIIPETKIINAILAIGIEKAKTKDIEKYLELNEEINQ
jgi:hypothetical protein